MKAIRALNHFFLHEPDEVIQFSEYIIFYGFYVTVAIIVLFTALSI